jgi:hypothetical protein
MRATIDEKWTTFTTDIHSIHRIFEGLLGTLEVFL